MQSYFLNFHVKGEVAHTLLLSEPEPRLLVDISAKAANDSPAPGLRYPNRVSFTVRNKTLIERFCASVAHGDVIEATGTFDQSGYIAHRAGHIDTTFELLEFTLHHPEAELTHDGRTYSANHAGFVN